jgi:tetratricopeptide (TPR) repeat protein
MRSSGASLKKFDKDFRLSLDPAFSDDNKSQEDISTFDLIYDPILNQSEYLYNSGAYYFKLEKYEHAIEKFDKAIEILDSYKKTSPFLVMAWWGKGNALYFQGKYDETIQAYDKAIELEPQVDKSEYPLEYANVQGNRGIALYFQGKYDEAIKAYDRAIEINPRYAPAWYNKGLILYYQGRYDEAIKACDSAIEINPRYEKLRQMKGHITKTLIHNTEAADTRRRNTTSERQELIESIAHTASDYRLGEIEAFSPEHVDRWIRQFPEEVQLPLLRELDHVLKQTYLSKKRVTDLLEGRLMPDSSDSDFWRRTHFLNIQQGGNSQKELLAIFDGILEAKCGFNTMKCGETGGDFLYLDDVLFSGSRILKDLQVWIAKNAPDQVTIYVVVLAAYWSGYFRVEKNLKKIIASSGKKIDIKLVPLEFIENRKDYMENWEVLCPTALPDDPDLKAFLDLPQKFPLVTRPTGDNLGPFSSEQGRQLLEHELLLAGVKIRAACSAPSDDLRPLGYNKFGFGFGSMIVTFRNCPNTCPLALWWSIGEWYPLFKRKTYSENAEAEINSWIQSIKLKNTNDRSTTN